MPQAGCRRGGAEGEPRHEGGRWAAGGRAGDGHQHQQARRRLLAARRYLYIFLIPRSSPEEAPPQQRGVSDANGPQSRTGLAVLHDCVFNYMYTKKASWMLEEQAHEELVRPLEGRPLRVRLKNC